MIVFPDCERIGGDDACVAEMKRTRIERPQGVRSVRGAAYASGHSSPNYNNDNVIHLYIIQKKRVPKHTLCYHSIR